METFCIGVIAIGLILWYMSHVSAQKRQEEQAERRRQEEAKRVEKKRLEECGQVVQFFLSELGYIARDVISKDEIEFMIDEGADADLLSSIIADRIIEYDALVLGVHQGTDFPVKLKQSFRDRHTYIIGKSGSGKTTLLRQMIMQDMEAGHGVGVIAPEQEMITEELLPFVPEHRLDDVLYFNPADNIAPVSFNPLHLDEGEDLDQRADENMTIFNRLMEGETTPRTNEILRQSFYALLPLPDTTLLDIPRLLERENPHFRNQVLTQIEDLDTLHFWRDTYPQFPKNAHLPIVYRLSRFTRPKYIRNVLCQPHQSISFRDIMDEGKIAFFNLSDGILGEQNSQLLGQLIVSKFQLAVMGRASIPKEKRRRFYLYIDEFQTFTSTASASYEKILSRARKYRLALILAHQQTGQLPSHLLKEIFGNVSTTISFVVSREDAKRLSPELISTSGTEVLKVDPDRLVALKVGSTYAKIGTTSFAMRTQLVTKRPDYDIKRRAIERSRANYGTPLAGQRIARPEPDSPDAPFDLTDPEAF